MDLRVYGRWLIVLFIITLSASIYMITASILPQLKGGPARSDNAMLQLAKSSFYPADTIAVLSIMSPISYSSDEGGYLSLERSGSVYWVSLLKSIEDNPNIKAVLLRINSPGGTIAATQEVYNQILRLKEKGKFVAVSMGDMAASGAYYIACAADYIIANKGTLTGSIGVIMANFNFSGLMKKFGVEYNVIKSGKNKDMFSSYRQMSPEEREMLHNVVMDSYDQFFRAVMKGRNIKANVLRPIADGRIFTGRQALKYKLVDELGDFEDAIEKTADRAGIKGKPNVIELRLESRGLLRYITASIGRWVPFMKLDRLKTPISLSGDNYSPVLYLFNLGGSINP